MAWPLSRNSDAPAPAPAPPPHPPGPHRAPPPPPHVRLPLGLSGSSGFVYYVSITGVTGTRSASDAELAAALPRLRAATRLPVAIGFGIRSPAQAASAVRVADGAVVASSLIETLARSLDERGRARPDTVRLVLDQVRTLAEGVRTARREREIVA